MRLTVSGAEALAVMRDQAASNNISIDCVVLDYHMPQMNGGDVVKRDAGGSGSWRTFPVIMLTSVDETNDGKAFSSLGVQGHLTKPTRSSLLLETIISVLQDKQNRESGADDTRAGAMIARQMGNLEASETPSAAPSGTLLETCGVHAQQKTLAEALEPNAVDRAVGRSEHRRSPLSPDTIDILVCEDNEVNQIVFTQILQETGCTFRIANNGKEGLSLYRHLHPTLILMDVSMPQMNGLEATKAIRNIEKETGEHTPIIGVTAHAIKGDMEKCLEAGMDDYLTKPVSPVKLEEKINHWLKQTKTKAA